MPLNASTGSIAARSAIQSQIDKLLAGQAIKSNTDIAKDVAAAYHNYAKSATLPGADCTQGGTVAILEAAFIADNTSGMIDQIAQGLCDYWASFVAPGVPAHGGSAVISVVVSATSVFVAMKAAVQALITDVEVADAWLDFYQATEAVVKTIPCVITETMPGSPPYPQAWPELIS